MLLSLLHTLSLGGSTVGYTRVQMLSVGAYSFAAQYLVLSNVVVSRAIIVEFLQCVACNNCTRNHVLN